MKILFIFLFFFAQSETVENPQMDISGVVEDEELKMLNNEIQKTQSSLKGLEVKGEKYGQLKTALESMSEKHKRYLEQKKSYETVVNKFNKQVDCSDNSLKKGCNNSFQENINGLLKENAPNLEKCAPGLKVSSTIEVALLADGRIQKLNYLGAHLPKASKKCIQNVFMAIEFPKVPDNKGVTLRVPLKFSR